MLHYSRVEVAGGVGAGQAPAAGRGVGGEWLQVMR